MVARTERSRRHTCRSARGSLGHYDAVDQVEALTAVMNGDAVAVSRLDRSCLAETAASMGPLLLSRSALRAALTALRAGTVGSAEAQQWASFMKRGAGTGNRPVDIEWEDEDLFADVLMRMDELGDLVDGTMSIAEIDQHIASLGRA